MQDQLNAFNSRGPARAISLHSNLARHESQLALDQARKNKAVLLYVSPERLARPAGRRQVIDLKPKLLVIDEAHCVNQWGYDFRPSYLALRRLIETLRPCPVLALTATATPAARADILDKLGLIDPFVFVAPFDRPNIRFDVIPCDAIDKPRHLRDILSTLKNQDSSIVYVSRQADAEDIAAQLSAEGFGAVAYHGGMDPQSRREAQELWQSGQKPIAVATIAFGMGIDKPGVRSVINYHHPSSLEAFYQQAGRAGRDGNPARSVLLFSNDDASLSTIFIRRRYPKQVKILSLLNRISHQGIQSDNLQSLAKMREEPFNVAVIALTEQRLIWQDENGLICLEKRKPDHPIPSFNDMIARQKADHERLETMTAYAHQRLCHRALLLRYFGEPLPPDHACGNCSACSSPVPRHIKSLLAEVDHIFRLSRSSIESLMPLTPDTFAQFLGGSLRTKIASALYNLPQYGALSHVPMNQLREIASQIVSSTAPKRDPASKNPIFWKSPGRSFTIEELKKHSIPRSTGLNILKLVSLSDASLTPSGIAGILIGSKFYRVIKTIPQLRNLNLFGVEKRKSYDTLLSDTLALWSKGYLTTSTPKSKKLMLTEKGKSFLN